VTPEPLWEAFHARSDRPDDVACWRWLGSFTTHGYGILSQGKRNLAPHRVAFELYRHPIPDGLVLDHLCRNRWCVNPWHLEPVTNRTNILRGVGHTAVNAAKTHCINGHEFTPENTSYVSGGKRRCKTCTRERQRRYDLARSAARSAPTGEPEAVTGRE